MGIKPSQTSLEALKQAKTHIHLEYYIVRDDKIGRKIKEILLLRREQGWKFALSMMR